MATFWKQAAAIAVMNAKGLRQRAAMAASMMFTTAMVVIVLLGFLSLAQGFRNTLVQSGAEDVAVLIRGGAQTEINSQIPREQFNALLQAPGMAQVSPEVNLVVDGHRRGDGQRVNLSLRGLTAEGAELRDGFRLLEGRMFKPGANELVAGRYVAQAYRGYAPGEAIMFGTVPWTVVGVFEANASVAESEVWADLDAVQSLFERRDAFQSVRARLRHPPARALAALKAHVEADPRLPLSVQSERDYLALQAARSFDLIQSLGWPLALLMAIGAIVAAANTMHAAVVRRTGEIATLRAIGFAPAAALAAIMAESLAIALAGGALGALIAAWSLNGLTASTFGSGITQVGFSLALTPGLLLQGMLLAGAIGLLGGLPGAWRASRLPIAASLGR